MEPSMQKPINKLVIQDHIFDILTSKSSQKRAAIYSASLTYASLDM